MCLFIIDRILNHGQHNTIVLTGLSGGGKQFFSTRYLVMCFASFICFVLVFFLWWFPNWWFVTSLQSSPIPAVIAAMANNLSTSSIPLILWRRACGGGHEEEVGDGEVLEEGCGWPHSCGLNSIAFGRVFISSLFDFSLCFLFLFLFCFLSHLVFYRNPLCLAGYLLCFCSIMFEGYIVFNGFENDTLNFLVIKLI